MKEILIEVDSDGKVTIKTQGFQGAACLEAAKQLMAKLKALGIDANIEKTVLTPEYHQTQTTQQQVKVPT